MTTLKEIMQIAEKGYYDSYESIDTIVTDLSYKQMGEILSGIKPAFRNIFESVTDNHWLPESTLNQLTFMDFICLLIDTEDKMRERELEIDTRPDQFERFLICMLKHCLLEAEKSDLLVKEYLGINVDSFMHYLEGKHNDHKVSYIYSDMLGEADRVFSKDADKLIKKEMNIGDYLKSTLETERQTWSCWKDIKEYENTMLSANEMDRKLLLDSLSLGFRERMNVDDLLERYSVQDDLQIDYWEDCEDFFEGGEKDGENN